MSVKLFTVYCHINKINGKRYVGITSQQPEKRWNNGKGYKATTRFYSAIKKYGWDNFTHQILCTNVTKDEAIIKEKFLIYTWNLTDKRYGYNMTEGGEIHSYKGRKHTEETKRKISESHQGIRPSVKTLQKLSETHTNKGGKPVQMFLNDVLVGIFVTAAEAARVTKINASHIGACCRMQRKTAGGYRWRYL